MLASALLLAMAGGSAYAQQMPQTRRGSAPASANSVTSQDATKKVTKRLTSGGSNVYGYVGWDASFGADNPNNHVGDLCNFGPAGYTVKWSDPMWAEEQSLLRTGYLHYDESRDKWLLTGTNPVYYTGIEDIITVCYYSYDFETGKFDGAEFPSLSKPYFLCAAYNEEDGYVYGLAEYLKSQGGGSFYGRARIDDLSNIRQISPLDYNHSFRSMCWNCDDGMMYGMLDDGSLMQVDKDGKTLRVAKFNEPIGPWQTGLAYSTVEKIFYWNVNFPDGRSALYTIDPNKGEETVGTFTFLYNFSAEEEFYFFVCTDRKPSENAPAVSDVKEVNFPNGATTGSISFTTPTKLVNGNTIPSGATLRYQAYLDGSEYSGGNATPGETIELEFIELEEGMHSFSFTTSLNGEVSLYAARELYIGVDTPQAPAEVSLTEQRVSWKPVTDGIHGGWIDSADMTYEVYVDGKLMGTTKDCQLDITIPEETEIHYFCAEVIAVARGKKSEPGISNYIVAGSPLTLPVFFEPNSDDNEVVHTLDVNGDGNGWLYSAPSKAWVCLHSLKGEGDDWLFLPPVRIPDADKYYVLSFDSKIVNETYNKEYMEVMVGKGDNPSDMTTTVKSVFTPAVDYANYEALVKVAEPGVYYIGFHYLSEEMQNGIYLKNVGISADALAPGTPAYAESITATPGEKGALEVTMTFTMPTKDISGQALASNAELSAKVSAASDVTVTGKPGDKMTAKVATVQGMNNVKIQVSLGEDTGLAAPSDVWTGVDIPTQVVNLQADATPDMMSVHLSWETPVEGMHGGWVGDAPMSYDIYRYMPSFFGMQWSKVGSAGTDMEYTYTFENGAPQDLYPFGVRPKNAAGSPGYVTITAQMAGTPYLLPMEEDFGNYENDFSTLPWVVMNPDASYTGNWAISSVSEYDPSMDGYLFVANGARGSKAQVAVPRFSTKGMDNVMLSFQLFGGEDMTGMDILASDYDNPEPMKIGSIPANKTEGLYKAYLQLPSTFLNKDWVAIYYDVTFGNNANLLAVRRMLIADGTGVETIAENSGVAVLPGQGNITVFGAEGESIEIYAADGRKAAYVAKASEAETISLAPGVYIVRGLKVIVK